MPKGEIGAEWKGIVESFFREGDQDRTFWERDIAPWTEGKVEINVKVEGNRLFPGP